MKAESGVKTHYQLLGLAPDADADAIKKAFRREIARYHPDKVVHLGSEFQDMAAVRAAELTVAYKTLSDQNLRAQYDTVIAGAAPAQAPAPESAVDVPSPSAPAAEEPLEHKSARGRRFDNERAGRDAILRRAIVSRVHSLVEALHGPVDTPTIRGFDLAIVPTAKARFLGSAPPRVLVKVADVTDAAAVTDAWTAAARARVHAGKSPVLVMLFASRIAAQHELFKAFESVSRQRKPPDAPFEIAIVAVDSSDWSCRLPASVSSEVRKLVEKICH